MNEEKQEFQKEVEKYESPPVEPKVEDIHKGIREEPISPEHVPHVQSTITPAEALLMLKEEEPPDVDTMPVEDIDIDEVLSEIKRLKRSVGEQVSRPKEKKGDFYYTEEIEPENKEEVPPELKVTAYRIDKLEKMVNRFRKEIEELQYKKKMGQLVNEASRVRSILQRAGVDIPEEALIGASFIQGTTLAKVGEQILMEIQKRKVASSPQVYTPKFEEKKENVSSKSFESFQSSEENINDPAERRRSLLNRVRAIFSKYNIPVR